MDWSVCRGSILMLFVALCQTSFSSARRSRTLMSNELEFPKEDEINSSNYKNVGPAKVNPWDSWRQFVEHSKRTDNSRKQKKRRDKSRNKLKRLQRGATGRPGPPGPMGPVGPPGADVTLDVIMAEFSEAVAVEAEQRANLLMSLKCPSCLADSNDSQVLLPEGVRVLPRVAAGFHQRLKANNNIARKAGFLEIKPYHRPFGGGAFQRGSVFDPDDGRFLAPQDGVYQFHVNMHLRHDGFSRGGLPKRLKRRDYVRLLLCIQSLCQRHTSLEYISGLETNSRTFTISLSGLLHLEKGQYTSVFMDNNSNLDITILEGSDFSGMLMGI